MFYMATHYNDRQGSVSEEFYEDIRRFRYLKRLLKRYYRNGELRERLILNHLIVLNNLFGVENAIRMLQFKIEGRYWPVLKTCLLFLGYIDEEFEVEIHIDMEIANVLREL